MFVRTVSILPILSQRTLTVLSSLLILISLGGFCLYEALGTIRLFTGSSSTFLSLGIGRPSEYTTTSIAAGSSSVPLDHRFYISVIFANIWQIALSVIYFQYNGILTAMLVSREWMRYQRRKPLRLTYPQSTTQRTSYFVSMPWRFGGPLLTVWALLHWSLSQSIFVLPLEEFDKVIREILNPKSFQTVNGFSVWAIIMSKL